MVEVPQTVNYLSEPLKEIKAAMADGTYHYDGNPVMTWMFSNVIARPDKKDNLFPYKESDDQKIDGPIAGIMGVSRAMAGAEKDMSIYEDREIVLL
jgi:phage terminase large subunit-like protein